MSHYHLGEFEEVVLLTVAILQHEAYGVSIIQEMEKRLNRNVSIGALQTVLRRLENKKLLKSELGEATKIRGGKKKKIFLHYTGRTKDLKAGEGSAIGLMEGHSGNSTIRMKHKTIQPPRAADGGATEEIVLFGKENPEKRLISHEEYNYKNDVHRVMGAFASYKTRHHHWRYYLCD